MCITSNRPLKAKKARRDITVYKLFRVIYDENNPKNVIMTGPYYNDMRYSLENLHVMRQISVYYGTPALPILVRELDPGRFVYQTGEGLYSFENMKQVRELFKERSDLTFSINVQYKAYKCIIPKDTTHIKKKGEYVSTYLYVTSEEIQLN